MGHIDERIEALQSAKDLRKFHDSPRVAAALAVEVGELQELYLWGGAPSRERVEGEIADVYIFLSTLARLEGVDIEEAVSRKLDEIWKRPVLDGGRLGKSR